MSRQYSTGRIQDSHRAAADTAMDETEDIPRSPDWQHDHRDQVRVDSHGRPILDGSSEGHLATRFNDALRLSENDPNRQAFTPFRDTLPYSERTIHITTEPRKPEDLMRYADGDYEYALWLWDFLGQGKRRNAPLGTTGAESLRVIDTMFELAAIEPKSEAANGGPLFGIADGDTLFGLVNSSRPQHPTSQAGPSQSNGRRSYRRSSETGEEIEVIEVSPHDRDSHRGGPYR